MNKPKLNSRRLREFALAWVFVFGTMGLWKALASKSAAVEILTTLALAVGLVGLVFPRTMRFPYRVAFALTYPIGLAVSRLALLILFYGLFTPVGLLFLLLKRDPLQLKKKRSETYWISVPKTEDLSHYLRQSLNHTRRKNRELPGTT